MPRQKMTARKPTYSSSHSSSFSNSSSNGKLSKQIIEGAAAVAAAEAAVEVVEAAVEVADAVVDLAHRGGKRDAGAHKHKHLEVDDGTFVVTTKQHFADRIVAIPEIVQREVVDEAYVSVPRKVVEKEKVIHVKEVVEIPEIEYVDEYVTEEYVQDVHRTVEKPVTVEREVEHIVHVDDIETIVVEVPDVTYEDVVVAKDVPVPQIIEKEVIVEKVVPRIQEEIIEDVNYVYKDREVRRNIPVPVEATIKQKFIAPRIEPVHKNRSYKVLLPEFSEHAVWSTTLTDHGKLALPSFQNRIEQLAGSSLCEVEKLFCDIKATDMEHENWLSESMLHSRMNLPYMGVENVRFGKPTFINTVEEARQIVQPRGGVHEVIVTEHAHTKKSKKCCSTGGACCKKGCCKKTPATHQTVHTTVPVHTGTVVRSQPQFIQVDSHLGHTTISPTARYAKRSVVSQH